MRMIGIYEDTDGKIKNNIYYSYDLWFKDTFSPATKIIAQIPLKVSGKTYQEKQEDLRQKAIEYQNTWSESNWSYGEIAKINDFFYKNGKRYGLLREFKGNGIL